MILFFILQAYVDNLCIKSLWEILEEELPLSKLLSGNSSSNIFPQAFDAEVMEQHSFVRKIKLECVRIFLWKISEIACWKMSQKYGENKILS